jgi:hypothetical protein
MTFASPAWNPVRLPGPAIAAAITLSLLGGCVTAGPYVPDTSAKAAPERDNGKPEDVFMRKPWEIWRGSHGIGRFHQEASVVFTDLVESFKISDIAIRAADGSDVRIEYVAIDLGEGSQSREIIRAFVYRPGMTLDQDLDAAARNAARQMPGARETTPLPLPSNYPESTRELAWTSADQSGFFQVILLHQNGWAVRLEITCPTEDVPVARRYTPGFLRAIRVGG